VQLVPADRYQTILLQENREEIFKSLLGKRHTRRRQNKLKKAGRVTLRRLLTKSEAQQHLSYFFLHHIRRFALLGKESSYARPEYRQFLRALMEEFDLGDRLRFEALELDGRPFAWHFSFQANGKFLLYQYTFDLDAWDYAPGEVLFSNLLQFAQDNVTREFDYGSGDEPYKARFATHSRETFSLYIEPPDLRGRLRGLLRAGQGYFYPLVRHIKQRAKAHSSTFRLFRSIRLSTSGVLSRIRQAKKNGALLKYGLHWTTELFRNIVWSKEELDMFSWERLVGPDGRPCSCSPCDSEVEIRMGRFGDLVDIARKRPDALVAYELPRFRRRLRKGDRIYIGRKSAHVVFLAWTSTSKVGDILNGKPSHGISPDRPTLVMYDCWTVPGLSNGASYRKLLSVLRLEAASEKLDLLIRYRADQATLRRELEHQGFLPNYRIIRYSFLYLFRLTRCFYTKRTVADPLLGAAMGT
jgi:hypothetical protein